MRDVAGERERAELWRWEGKMREMRNTMRSLQDQGSLDLRLPVCVDGKTTGIVLMPKPTDHGGAKHHRGQSCELI